MSHSYERTGMCRACASIHGCERWRDRDPQRLLLVACTYDEQAIYEQIALIIAVCNQQLRALDVVIISNTAYEEMDPKLVHCMKSMRTADVFVLQGSREFHRGTMEECSAMLLGYALALDRRVICVAAEDGQRPYHSVPQIEHVPTWADVLPQILRGKGS